MESLLGNAFVDAKGGKFSLQDVVKPDTKAVALYFSAHWCPPCRGFTPKLAQWYAKDLKRKGLEVVFISSDKGPSEFQSYLSEQPWFALPFEDRQRKAQLSDKFKVEGIPALVVIDARTGQLITDAGRSAVTQDPTGENLPWTPRSVLEVLSSAKLLKHGGGVAAWAEVQAETDVVGLYFSASWCGPCHKFTPQLASTYAALNAKAAGKKRFEVVFVSSDKDEASFAKYFAESMPWLALDYATGQVERSLLGERFNIEGIPSLVLLNAKTGEVYNADSVGECINDPSGSNFPWQPKACQLLSPATASQIGRQPAFIVFCATDDEANAQQEDLAQAVEVWRGKQEEGAICRGDVCLPTGGRLEGAEDVLFFVAGPAQGGAITARVKELTQFTQEGEGVVVLDLGQQAFAHSSKGAAPRSLRLFVQQYLAGQVEKRPLQKA